MYKSHSPRSALLLFSFLSFTSTSYAQNTVDEISLEGLLDLPFIEIATGTAIALEKAPAVATLITAQQSSSLSI